MEIISAFIRIFLFILFMAIPIIVYLNWSRVIAYFYGKCKECRVKLSPNGDSLNYNYKLKRRISGNIMSREVEYTVKGTDIILECPKCKRKTGVSPTIYCRLEYMGYWDD